MVVQDAVKINPLLHLAQPGHADALPPMFFCGYDKSPLSTFTKNARFMNLFFINRMSRSLGVNGTINKGLWFF